MKYKVTLNGRTYEIEVEAGKAVCLDEYEAYAPAPAAPVAAPVAYFMEKMPIQMKILPWQIYIANTEL